MIEPELTDVTVGITKNFVCSVYHSCQQEPTITWNYNNMQITRKEKTGSGLYQISYSNIAFLAAKEDHGKKLICTAKFSGGDITASVILHVKRVLLYDALGWEVSMPKDIHGLKGSCLVIPCSFNYKSNPPKNPRRVVWYQQDSKGSLVYDPLHSDNVIEKFRGKTDLYGKSDLDCSLLIKNLESSHNGEKLYTRIDPENIAWQNYETDDATCTVRVDATPQKPSISVYGGERTGDKVTVVCSTVHTCPYSKPTITLNGIEGSDEIKDESIKDGLLKTTLTRTGVVKAESTTIECSVTHHGNIRVTDTEVKSSKCVHHNVSIEPELADVTVGIGKNFVCSVYHSCQQEPTITWNYNNMQITRKQKRHLGLNWISYSNITFLAAKKEDHGKKLICTAKFSGGDITASVILHVKRVLLYDALGWEVSMPKDIHGLKGSCLVIPCSFNYKSNPPKNPRRVVWYQQDSKGSLVYDPLHPDNVIEKFRGKTDLYGESDLDCSLLIKNLESSHNGEKLYTRIDPENIAWQNYETDDATCTVRVDATPQKPSISVYGGERTGDAIIVACSAVHTCPYSRPNITLNGIEGSDEIKEESVKDGLLKITLTRTGVVKTESMTIECSVTHHGNIRVTDTEVKSSKCVHHNISIEPELADVTEGVAQNFTCTIYHSCQNENPTITWNYENMQVSSWNKKHTNQFQIAFSNITFLGAKEDHGKRLICTATFSGGNIETYVVLRVQEYQKPVDQILNETYFLYVADVIPKITALPRSCVVIPCSFKTDEEYTTELRVLWVTRKGGYMFHTDPVDVSDNFKGRTRLLGNPVEQNCTVEMDNVQTHDNGPFCFQAEREKERYRFNNSCVFIIMRAPDKPVMSSLPENIEPGTRVAVKCSVNHTCSSHPPEIIWSVPTAQETISHNHMGGGVWETVSAVTFIPTGYEEKDEIVCTAKFWGGKTQENTAFLSIRRLQRLKLEDVGLYAIVPSLVFILICVLAGVFICRRWHSRFSMPEGRVAWSNRGNRSDIGYTGNAPERPPKAGKRQSIWSRFSRHQSPRTNANLRAEYKANNTCIVSGNKPFSKPHMPSPKSEQKSYRGYDSNADFIYGNA
ncbi:uncharacterized protein LOC132107763 isoform X2 [Carassius carassius]|uniref:uncharacterized protein LOC132107763 isoform X2 n=1 Tax=Carassius carassius TaxID=217509 RepID=UPI0028697FAA|nr:uncharacterized protein LOC132107763 isoform X2 [Carassius carassius]